MSVILLLLAAIGIYIFTKAYAGDDSKILPASTPKGKEARVVGVVLLLLMIGAIIFHMTSNRSDKAVIAISVQGLAIGACVAIVRYLNFKRKR